MRRALRWMQTVAAVVRDWWLIVGATLLLMVLLEWAYLGQAAVRRGVRGLRGVSEGPAHPNRDEPWWKEWERREGVVNGPSRYDPYRGFWARPYAAPYVHVDSAGRRLTAYSATGPTAARVYMLGGSVMWGYTSRDSATIPSLVARQLRDAGAGPVEVVNLAQPSYNATQGLITLLLELRAGRVPAVVVSLDGSNDVLAAFREGEVGAALGQGDATRLSAVGRRGFWANVFGLVRFSALGDRLLKFAGPGASDRPTGEAAASDCSELAAQYRRLVEAGAGLGRTFGFEAVYLWQPHWATTAKPLTAWERAIRGEGDFPARVQQCTAAVDSTMASGDSIPAFESLTRIFNTDERDVFLDSYGHLTDVGNARVADRIAELVRRGLVQRGSSARDAEQAPSRQGQ